MRAQICYLCKKYLDKKLIVEDNEEEEDVDYDQDPLNDELAKVFACGHTYHFDCLRKHQRKRYPEGDLREIYLRVGCNRLKCPTCNISN